MTLRNAYCRQVSLPKRRVAIASVFAILICVGAIVATVMLVKKRDSPSEIRGAQVENNEDLSRSFADERVEDTTSEVRGANTEPPTAAATTALPTAAPTVRENPKESWGETVFYVIADVPYTDDEREDMPGLVGAIAPDGLFAVHLGDIKHVLEPCNEGALDTFANFVKKSAVPMFPVVGDNEYNDCSNPDEALELWRNGLVRFDQKHWNHSLPVKMMEDRPESFYFVNKGTLFIGLNIVGTPSFNSLEWDTRLKTQVDWTIQLIEEHRTGDNEVGAVVLFAHASPNGEHNGFFIPLRDYIRNVLQNALPLLYLCGDVHSFFYDPNYQNQTSWLRVRSEGGSKDPPLKVVVNPPKISGGYNDIAEVFGVERYW